MLLQTLEIKKEGVTIDDFPVHSLYKLSGGKKNTFDLVSDQKISYDMFTQENMFILDVGDHIFLWVGSKVSEQEKKKNVVYQQNYIGAFAKKPNWIPSCKYDQGKEGKDFWEVVSK